MGIKKNQVIKLKEDAWGHRLLSDAEWRETYNRIRDKYRAQGLPMMDDAGESIIVGRNHCESLGGCEVKVVSGRAKWDLDHSFYHPTNLMRVFYKGHNYLVSRKSVAED